MKRVGVIGVVIQGDTNISIDLQKLLHEYNDIIIGRMGVPDKENHVAAISIIVKGSNEQINALSGRIGRLSNVNVKSAITSVEI